jgi:hypothetical protein
MALKLTNNASSTLAATIDALLTTTTISIASGDAGKFPTVVGGSGDWFPVTVIDATGAFEIMRCTGRAGAVLTVVRAQEGTAARACVAGARVDLRLTVAALTALLALPMSASINLAGDDLNGRMKFTGAQAALAGGSPLGFEWSQSDLFYGVRKIDTPTAGTQTRFVWNDKADGTGNDIMSLEENGKLSLGANSQVSLPLTGQFLWGGTKINHVETVTTITAIGAFAYNKSDHPGVTHVKLEGGGGGGSGGGATGVSASTFAAGGGGGEGGCGETDWIDITALPATNTITGTIGGGGVPVVSGSAAGVATTAVVNSITYTWGGGSGGQASGGSAANTTVIGGSGGGCSGGSLIGGGATGQQGSYSGTATTVSGAGAGGHYGIGGNAIRSTVPAATSGNSGTGFCTGGGGAIANATTGDRAGGPGRQGLLKIRERYAQTT